jgi:hypothetical protein
MNKKKKAVLESLKQPSSWRGLIWILSALGVALSPEMSNGIMAVGAAVAGVVGVAVSD